MNLSSAIERTVSPTLRAASVRVSRLVRSPPERIFDALLDAEAARTLLFPGQVGDVISAQIDARVGGDFHIVRHRDGQDIEYSGEYLEIDRPHRLVFSLFVERYRQQDDRVIVELAPLAEHSLLVLTHELSLPDPVERSRIRRAWARVLDRLAAPLPAPLGAAYRRGRHDAPRLRDGLGDVPLRSAARVDAAGPGCRRRAFR